MRKVKKFLFLLLAMSVLFAAVYTFTCYSLYGELPTLESVQREWKRDTQNFKESLNITQNQVDHSQAKKKIAAMTPLYENKQSVVSSLREALVKREKTIKLYYHAPAKESNELAKGLYHEAILPTSIGDEGDYIQYHIDQIKMTTSSLTYDEGYYYTLSYQVSFRTSDAQEEAVGRMIKEIITPLQNKSTVDKIRFINNYITARVTYEQTSDDLCYTAYGALIKQKAVCQGYTLLMYRMLKEAGIDNRMITGTGISNGKAVAHSWNIIKIGNLYYDNDVTWNDSFRMNQYYLAGAATFAKTHQSDETFKSAAFQKNYPLSQTAYRE